MNLKRTLEKAFFFCITWVSVRYKLQIIAHYYMSGISFVLLNAVDFINVIKV